MFKSVISGCSAALLFFMSQVALAQGAAETEPETPAAAAAPAGRTVVRIDLPAILNSNLDYNFWGHKQTLFPLLVSVERHFGGRISGVGEVLINGGTPDAHRTGLSVQGRYYFMRRHQGPLGFYVAPTLSYRAIRQVPSYHAWEVRRNLGGAGVMLGAQVPVALKKRLLLDIAAGAMAWGKLRPDRVTSYRPAGEYYDDKTQYEQQGVMPDVRLGVGFRF